MNQCSREDLDRVMNETADGLSRLFGDRLDDVLLYGSYARGTQEDGSDIDVMALVRMPQTELSRYRRQVSDFSSDLDLKYGVLLSIVLRDADEFSRQSGVLPFYRNVISDGISYVRG